MIRLSLIGMLLFAFTLSAQELTSFSENGLYGYKQNKSIIIPATYSYAFDFTNNLGLVRSGEKWGYINAQNQVVVPFQFDRGQLFKKNVAEVLINGKMALIDTLGNFIIEPENELFYSDYGEVGYTIVNDGKKGYIPLSRNYTVPCSYADVRGGEEYASALREDGLWDIYANGKLQLEGVDQSMYYSKRVDGSLLAVNSIQGKKGISDMNGDWRINPSYDKIQIVTNYRDRMMFTLENKLEDGSREIYFANGKGELFNQEPYTSIENFYDGNGSVSAKDKVGYIKNFGQFVIKPIYDTLIAVSAGYIAMKDGKFGIIDSVENVIVPFKSDGFSRESVEYELYDDEYMDFLGYETIMEMILLKNGKKSAFYFPLSGKYMKAKNRGEVTLSADLNGGLIKKKGKYGLIAEDLIIPPIYESIFMFGSSPSYLADEYMSRYEEDVIYWGVIDDQRSVPHFKDEREKLPKYELEQVSGSGGLHFDGEKAALYGVRSGKLVTEYIFDGARNGPLDDAYAILRINDKYGLYSYDGQELLPPIYDGLEYYGFDVIYVTMGTEKYLMNIATGEKFTEEWEEDY